MSDIKSGSDKSQYACPNNNSMTAAKEIKCGLKYRKNTFKFVSSFPVSSFCTLVVFLCHIIHFFFNQISKLFPQFRQLAHVLFSHLINYLFY